MDPQSIAMIAALVVLVSFSAYFSASETAFTSLNRIRLRSKAENGDGRAALALRLSEDYDRFLSTILIGNNIVNISASTVGTVLFTKHIGDAYGPLVSTIVLTAVVLIFGEISPKSLAKENAESFAMFSAPLLRVFLAILRPVNFVFSQWKRLLGLLFRHQPDEGITEEELITMVDQAENEGGLDQDESQLIRSAIEFGDLEVDEILTPRVDIVAVEDTDTMDDIAKAFAESGYSRLPVYHEDIDNIVGVIHEKDFHAARYHGHDDVSAIVSNVLYTTASTKISDLLRILQKAKAHMVIVVDEYGGTAGLVTMEDLLEEIVGNIYDEFDKAEQPEIVPLGENQWRIAGSTPISTLVDDLELPLPESDDYDTLGGLIVTRLNAIPKDGEQFDMEIDGVALHIEKIEDHRIESVVATLLPKEEPEEK